MTVNLTPEQERFIQEELQSGHFRTAEEVIANALLALREKEILLKGSATVSVMKRFATC